MVDLHLSLTQSIFKAWFSGEKRYRLALKSSIVLVVAAIIVIGVIQPVGLDKRLAEVVAAALAFAAAVLSMGVVSHQNLLEEQVRISKIEKVEELVKENPEKPQLAWDLARIKLESYLDRNLAQVRSIYWLTLLVMFVGFAFILYGLYHSFKAPDKLPVTIIAAGSGVIITFIGGSLLLIYRSILAQSKDYVSVLERINAVGMAVQVMSNISDSNLELRNQTTSEIAKQLLGLYAAPPKGGADGNSNA